jgi:hypothetical protein
MFAPLPGYPCTIALPAAANLGADIRSHSTGPDCHLAARTSHTRSRLGKWELVGTTGLVPPGRIIFTASKSGVRVVRRAIPIGRQRVHVKEQHAGAGFPRNLADV